MASFSDFVNNKIDGQDDYIYVPPTCMFWEAKIDAPHIDYVYQYYPSLHGLAYFVQRQIVLEHINLTLLSYCG